MKKVLLFLATCLTLSAISQPITPTATVYPKATESKRKMILATRPSWVECIGYFKLDTINDPGSNFWVDATNFNIAGIQPQSGEYLLQDNMGIVTKPETTQRVRWFSEYQDSSYTAVRQIQIKDAINIATQTLAITGNTLNISAGNSIILPSSNASITAGSNIAITQSGTNYTISNSAPNPTSNFTVAAYSSGTAYNYTTTAQRLTFGTTSPTITIPSSGTWLIMSNVRVDYTGLTNLAVNTINNKLRRTNNTAADIPNATGDFLVPPATLLTATGGDCDISSVVYTTSNNNDIIELWGNRSNGISVGNIQAGSAWILAIKLKD